MIGPVVIGQTYSLITDDYPLMVQVCERLSNTSALVCRDLLNQQDVILDESLFLHFEVHNASLECVPKELEAKPDETAQSRRNRRRKVHDFEPRPTAECVTG